MKGAWEVSSLCPDVAKAFEYSQDVPFDASLASLSPIIRTILGSERSQPAINAARVQLREHPICRWLRSKIPKADFDAIVDAFDEAVAVLVLLTYVMAGGADKPSSDGNGAGNARRDKKRKTAANTIDRLKGYLNDGTIELPVEQGAQLWALLTDASSELRAKRRKHVDHPGLLAVARVLVLSGVGGHAVLLEAATLAGIDCDDSTARRYITTATEGAEIGNPSQ